MQKLASIAGETWTILRECARKTNSGHPKEQRFPRPTKREAGMDGPMGMSSRLELGGLQIPQVTSADLELKKLSLFLSERVSIVSIPLANGKY